MMLDRVLGSAGQLGPLHIFSFLKKTHNITPFIIYILLKVYYINQINV